MKNYKELPLTVLDIVATFSQTKDTRYDVFEEEGCLVAFKDKDPQSNFYFHITAYEYKERKFSYLVKFKPKSPDSTGEAVLNLESGQISVYRNTWAKNLETYDHLIGQLEDPILKKYQKEYFSDFQLIDEDADTASYNYSTQLWLDTYLESFQAKLLQEKNEINKEEVEHLWEDIEELRKTQTQLTKKIVIERFTKILAKARKLTIRLIKDVYNDGRSEIIKYFVGQYLGG